MEFQKNQELIVDIDGFGKDGEGIGHVDGYALFVKDALPGERVRIKVTKCKKNYGYGRLMEILPVQHTDSDLCDGDVGRVEPRCPVARQCGGCTLQHLSYEKQLAFKEKKVRDCLERIGGVDCGALEWLPIIGMEEPWHYRNKAQFPVRMRQDETGQWHPVTGFFAGRTHALIPATDCAIQDTCMKEILDVTLRWMEEQNIPAYDEKTHQGAVRHIYIRRGYHTGQILACVVLNQNGLPKPQSQRLVDCLIKIAGMASISFNINRERTNVILGSKMIWLWGAQFIEDTIGDIRYRISPQSFYQVNPLQTEKLYETALDFAGLSGNEVVWDLYCGIGTISLFLARRAKKVYGVEIVPEAIDNARENARLNGIQNVEFFCGAAEEVVPGLVSGAADEMAHGLASGAADAGGTSAGGVTNAGTSERVDVVVVDPPRKGCDAVLLDTIAKMAPEKIVYVSCDPATLARDVKVLGEKGYEVRRVRACDMFPMGGHVETVCVLGNKNRKPDDYLRVEIDVDKIHEILDKEKAEGEAKEKSQFG